MPITIDDARKKLVSSGKNPDEYDLDNIVNQYNTAEASAAPAVQPSTDTPLQTFGRTALRATPPIIAGGIGAAASAIPALRGAGLLTKLGVSGVGALAGSTAGGIGEEALLKKIQGPEEYQKSLENLQQSQEQNPLSAKAGQIVPMLLQAGISPSLTVKGLLAGGRGLVGKTLTEAEKKALTHVAANVGVAGGTDIAAQNLLEPSEQPFSYSRLAEQMGIGALFNKPQLLGKTRLFGYSEPQKVSAEQTQPPPHISDYNYNEENRLDQPLTKPKFDMFQSDTPDWTAENELASRRRFFEGGLNPLNPSSDILREINRPRTPEGQLQSNRTGQPVASPGNLPEPLINTASEHGDLETLVQKVLRRLGLQPVKAADVEADIQKRQAFNQSPIIGQKIPLKTAAEIANPPKGNIVKPSEQSQPLTHVVGVPFNKPTISPTEAELIAKRKIISPEPPGIKRVGLNQQPPVEPVVKPEPTTPTKTNIPIAPTDQTEPLHNLTIRRQEPQANQQQQQAPAKSLITSEEFKQRGVGHVKFHEDVTKLAEEGTLHPAFIPPLLELTKDIPDAWLAKGEIKSTDKLTSRAGLASMTGALKGPLGENQVNSWKISLKKMMHDISTRASDAGDNNLIKMLKRDPDVYSITTFLHEFAHPIQYELGASRMKVVQEAYDRLIAEGKIKRYIREGMVGETSHNPDYYASNVREFWAQSFAEYALGKMYGEKEPYVPISSLKDVFKYAYFRFVEGIKRVLGRNLTYHDAMGQEHSVNDRLGSVFESVLRGEKDTEFKPAEGVKGNENDIAEAGAKLTDRDIKDNTKSLEELNYKIPYYAWITPEGEFINVNFLEHSPVAEYITGLKEYEGGIAKMKDLGYLRLSNIDNNLHIQGNVTNTQHRILRDAAIYNKNGLIINGISDPEIGNREIKGNDIELSGAKESLPDNLPNDEIKARPEITLPGTRSLVDRVTRLSSTGKLFAEQGATPFYEDFRSIKGHYLEASGINDKMMKDINLLHPYDYATKNNDRNQGVLDSMLADKEAGVRNDKGLTPEQIDLKNTLSNTLTQIANDVRSRGILIEGKREHGVDPLYFPEKMKANVIDILLNHPDSPEAKQLTTDWINQREEKFGATPEEALKELNEVKAQFGNQGRESNIASQYGPIDKAEGRGLPDSFREKNLINVINSYVNRVARRFSYFDNIESKPEMLNALGIKKDVNGGDVPETPGIENISGANDVKTLLRDIQGQHTAAELKREAVNGIVRAGMLGFGTGVTNFAQNLTQGFAYFTPKQVLEGWGSAIHNFQENTKASFAAGINTRNIGQLEASISGVNEVVSGLKGLRDVMNTIQLRNFSEKLQRTIAFGQGKFATIDNINYLQNNNVKGNSQRTRFMDNFAPKDWRARIGSTEGFSDADIDQMAARYVEAVQGTYDYRQLPPVAVEGTLSPFLAISRWNIGQANVFMKSVVNPALHGEFAPLLMSTIGAALGGTAVMEIRKLMTGRKEHIASIDEIKQAGAEGQNIAMPIYYKAAALADAAGFMGILGSFARVAGDIVYKNRPQMFTAPLIHGITNSFDHLTNAVQAFNDGNIHVGLDTLSTIVEDYLQTYRIALSTIARLAPEEPIAKEKSQQIEMANKLRDLRTFKQLYNYPISPATLDRANVFENADVRQLKQSQDIGETQKLLPQVVSRLVAQYRNNPELLGKILQGLKQNSYQTIPSPDRMPGMAGRYLGFVGATQGDLARQKLVQDYYRQRALNSVKAGAIPSW